MNYKFLDLAGLGSLIEKLKTIFASSTQGNHADSAYQHSLLKSGNPHKVTKSDIGLSNVENKSSATIRSELNKSEVIDALGYDPPTTNTTYTLTKSGSTITLTGSDGEKTSVTDSDTKYSLSSFGVTSTSSELNYLDGVTSNVQTQLNGKLSTTGTAAKAIADSSGQNIADTYIKGLSVNGRTITYTKGDGGTGTITTQDTNTTYSNMEGSTSTENGKSGLVPAPSAGKQTSFLRGDGTWVIPTNTTYSQATSSNLGLVKIGYVENGKNYPVELSNGQMFVNVPWTDTNTTYSQATSTTAGLVKIGFTESGKNYPVELNTSGQMFVNVPWTDTNTTYGLASTSANGLLKQLNGSTSQFMRGDGTWATPPNTTYNVATETSNGLLSSTDKVKLDSIATGANKYVLPTASSTTLGGVKTTSQVTSSSGYTACPIISGVPYYKDTNTTYTLSSFGVTATAAELNKLDGCTATVTELNYVDGVTSNIQTQLNGKAPTSHNHSAANITSGTLPVSRGGTGGTSALTARSNIDAINILAQDSQPTSQNVGDFWLEII